MPRLCRVRWLGGLARRTLSSKSVAATSAETADLTVKAEDIANAMKKVGDDSPSVANKVNALSANNSILTEFLDDPVTWGRTELRPIHRPGRSWFADELRLKSNADLHKLWYVLVKERNMLLTMKEAYSQRARFFPNPERLDRVKESMDNIETVVHERNDAVLRLETGDGASPPMRTVTSFMGFTQKKQTTEHYEPFEVSACKEYEVPYLDDDAHLMQRLWREKEYIKSEIASYDQYFRAVYDEEERKFGRTLRRTYDRPEDMPRAVLRRQANERTKKLAATANPTAA